MTGTITHHKTVPLQNPNGDLNGSANVCMFGDRKTIVTLSAALGAATMQLHIDAASLIALAKLLNEAVEKLPVQVEEAA